MQREIEHEREARARDGGERDARDARRDGRVVDGERDERDEEGEPHGGDVRGAHVPAIEIEIGEQEHQQRRGENGFRARAPDAVGFALDAEQLVPESEVDAHVGEHGPCERCGGGEDHRALHHEDDGEEQRQQARDADDDALVEREVGDLVAIGVRLPQVDLRQVGRAQFGDVGDGRARIERQAEHVGLRAVLALGREALARGDGGDARGAEVRPDDARARQHEMRRDDQPVELLVGVVGEREHDPRGLRAGLARGDFDAAHDAVDAGRGGDLQAVALARITVDGARQVDGAGVDRHADGFHRVGGRKGARQRENRAKHMDQPTHNFPVVSAAGAAGRL